MKAALATACDTSVSTTGHFSISLCFKLKHFFGSFHFCSEQRGSANKNDTVKKILENGHGWTITGLKSGSANDPFLLHCYLLKGKKNLLKS